MFQNVTAQRLKKPLMWMGIRLFLFPILFVLMMTLAKFVSDWLGVSKSGRFAVAALGVSPFLLYSKYMFKYDYKLIANQKIPFLLKASILFGAFGLGILVVIATSIALYIMLR
jgi:hypothetical protein